MNFSSIISIDRFSEMASACEILTLHLLHIPILSTDHYSRTILLNLTADIFFLFFFISCLLTHTHEVKIPSQFYPAQIWASSYS